MRRFIPGVFIVLLIAMPTFGRSAARGLLQRVIPTAKFDNVSLADSMDFLSSVSGANIVVDWKSLSDANITKQTQINLNLHDITLQRLLTMVLREASAGGTPLTWYIEDNIITVTTQAVADSKNVTVVYYVLDIIMSNSQFNGIISNPNCVTIPLTLVLADFLGRGRGRLRMFDSIGAPRPPRLNVECD